MNKYLEVLKKLDKEICKSESGISISATHKLESILNLVKTCHNCLSPVKLEDNFCKKCGANMRGDT